MKYSDAYEKAREWSFNAPHLVYFLVRLSNDNQPEIWEVDTKINMKHSDYTGHMGIFSSGKMIYSTWRY